MVAKTKVMSDIALDTMIPGLLRAHPEARNVLDRYGLHGCGGHRGPVETLRFFARAHGVDESSLSNEINDCIDHPQRKVKFSPTADCPAIDLRAFVNDLNELVRYDASASEPTISDPAVGTWIVHAR